MSGSPSGGIGSLRGSPGDVVHTLAIHRARESPLHGQPRTHYGTRRVSLLRHLMPDTVLSVARGLAGAFLAGDWDPPAMTRRGQKAVGQRRVWVRDLALAARHAYPSAPRDRPHELAEFLGACPPLTKAFAVAARRIEPAPRMCRWFVASTAMGEARWPVPALDSTADLRAMLGLSVGHLAWFGDTSQLERTVSDERLRHYRYQWAMKASGGLRVIEEPKPLLKHFQRVILREILEKVPVHDAAQGFCRGRSALSYAAGHAGQSVVVRLDLEDFFTSIAAGRVFGIFPSIRLPRARGASSDRPCHQHRAKKRLGTDTATRADGTTGGAPPPRQASRPPAPPARGADLAGPRQPGCFRARSAPLRPRRGNGMLVLAVRG